MATGVADVRGERCSESPGDPRGGPGRGSVGRRRPPGARARAPTRGSAGAPLGRRGRCRAVRRTLTYASGEIHFGPPKSAAGERDIALPVFVERALRRHRAPKPRGCSRSDCNRSSSSTTGSGDPGSGHRSRPAGAGSRPRTGSAGSLSTGYGMERRRSCSLVACRTRWQSSGWATPTRRSSAVSGSRRRAPTRRCDQDEPAARRLTVTRSVTRPGLGCADVAADLVVPTGFEPVSPP